MLTPAFGRVTCFKAGMVMLHYCKLKGLSIICSKPVTAESFMNLPLQGNMGLLLEAQMPSANRGTLALFTLLLWLPYTLYAGWCAASVLINKTGRPVFYCWRHGPWYGSHLYTASPVRVIFSFLPSRNSLSSDTTPNLPGRCEDCGNGNQAKQY